MVGLKSSPIPSELPLTQIPRWESAFQVFNPLVQTILEDDKKDSSGNADLREIQIQLLFSELTFYKVKITLSYVIYFIIYLNTKFK